MLLSKVRWVMKIQSKKAEEKVGAQGISPICDVVASKGRGRLTLSAEDMETIRQLAQNPPLPTPELISTLRQNRKKQTRKNKSDTP